MTADSSERLVLLNHLADEFAARYRRGERPALQEYIDQHPELADDIREFFPAMAEMEQVKDDRQAPVEHAGLPYYVMQFIPGLGLDEVLEELKHLQGGEPGGVSPGSMKRLTAGELRVSRREVSAADVARSLLTGQFAPAADEEANAPVA